jgi:hypothetical protein
VHYYIHTFAAFQNLTLLSQYAWLFRQENALFGGCRVSVNSSRTITYSLYLRCVCKCVMQEGKSRGSDDWQELALVKEKCIPLPCLFLHRLSCVCLILGLKRTPPTTPSIRTATIQSSAWLTRARAGPFFLLATSCTTSYDSGHFALLLLARALQWSLFSQYLVDHYHIYRLTFVPTVPHF